MAGSAAPARPPDNKKVCHNRTSPEMIQIGDESIGTHVYLKKIDGVSVQAKIDGVRYY